MSDLSKRKARDGKTEAVSPTEANRPTEVIPPTEVIRPTEAARAPVETAASGPRLTSGSTIAGRYRIESYLASGGMGQVYRAHDLDLNVPLALKTIRPEIASSPAALRRFKQEVLLARSVSHPNVCRIFDLGHDEATGVSFLTMEFLPGETLTSRIEAKGALDREESLPLVRQLADALDAAHRAGIVHRDFKSPNVMLVPTDAGDRAVITDFGLAMTVGKEKDATGRPPSSGAAPKPPEVSGIGAGPTTHERNAEMAGLPETLDGLDFQFGGMVGTPAYMSPEQVIGDPVGPASDLYALGVVLFEMSTGRLPFHGVTPLQTARARLTDPPPSPSKLAEIEEDWEQTILRLLSREPADRYASAHDAVLALEGQINGRGETRHSLPPEHDAFVGRKSELDALASHLEGTARQGATRLLTLHGPGGTGKTRLSQKYGWKSLRSWPGGVWFCSLTEARSLAGIARAVATSLDVPLGKGDPVLQLGHAIAGRGGKSLVILDNFEQLVEHAGATLGHWLDRCPETSFLVTSRERLHLPEERTYDLEPLDPTTHGVELFEVRARGHHPGFAVDESNRAQVEEIVERLEGLPLAIELAASRLRVLNLEQLRDRLANRFRILAGGERGRHATLEATLNWSWELLQPWEQSAIAQVSVFEGGFTLEAAEAVIDLSAFDQAPIVLDAIQSLVDKSWLRAVARLEAPRFETYATVKEYASARLHLHPVKTGISASADPSPRREVESRHGEYFAGMGTEEFITGLSRHGGVARRAALQLELDNLVIAFHRAMEREDEETAEATYVAASTVFALRGPLGAPIQLGNEVLGILKDPARRGRALVTLASAERLSGKMEEAQSCYEAALAIHRQLGSRRDEGFVLGCLSVLFHQQGRMEKAQEYGENALDLYRETGDRAGEGAMLTNLAHFHRTQGRMEEALEHYEVALAIHLDLGDRHSEGVVLCNLAELHREQGRMGEARGYYEAALGIFREEHHRAIEGIVLGNLGILHHEQGRETEAREHYEAALAIHRDVGNRHAEGHVLGNLGNFHSHHGRMEEARGLYEGALRIHREVGDRRSEGFVLGNLGNLHHDQGRLEMAHDCYEAALAIHRDVRNRRSEGVLLANLGDLLHDQGQEEQARGHYEAALVINREVGDRRSEGVVLGSLGELHRDQGRLKPAGEDLEAALAIHREVSNRSSEGVVLRSLGHLHREQGRTEEARRCFNQAISIFRELSESFELGKALCSLGDYEVQQENLPVARAALAEAESIARDLSVGPESELARQIIRLRQALPDDEDGGG